MTSVHEGDAAAGQPTSEASEPEEISSGVDTLTRMQLRRERKLARRAKRKERKAARSPLNRGIRRALVATVVLGSALVLYSFGSALAKPNNDPVGIKAVSWFRDNNLGFVVNFAERTFYTWNAPKKGGVPKGGIPTAASEQPTPSNSAAVTTTTFPRPKNIATLASPPLANEGAWQPAGKLVDGHPVAYVTYMRPDAVHTGKLVGVAWFNSKNLRAELYNGTEEPGGKNWTNGSRVEPADYGPLVATFNGGFKLNGSLGGYYSEGRMVRPLVDGRASIIVRSDGSIMVGEWGREAVMGPDIKSVRQNLSLLVDRGEPAPDLNSNFQSRWGATLGNSLYVWRSGVGVDRQGGLIYVGGPAMSVQSLANVFMAAGAYNAMQLDINTDWVSAHTYTGGDNGVPIDPSKLLSEMTRPANRHLAYGTRDFVALFAKPAPPVPTTTTATPSTTTTSKPGSKSTKPAATTTTMKR
ncbi:MAG: phosphodiester glycosidase family protein [Acidimicrobiia bacterium]